ncbi:MBL fold metallo-hydrolase [Alteraurantiacibacter aquimixticola]|uniref:MBL fold metallo-hydrolase n=1 Tax=Alteraurantiacibacter aquimixticola TaxID=2489173 RepID=A0A4T3EXU1_9SPHN|nr:MBL fold metallo-hydrolase [Alteraurantiacibacter aquimixticola]TIX49468.1 MBL fold metallo-hydrolase [Alteraurantiacibacter aquimixticola]
MQPIKLGRMTIHKVHEMDSPTPMTMNLPGVTPQDLARLKQWYDPEDGEITLDPETSQMNFSVHSFVIEVDGQTILVDTCDGNHKNRLVEAVHQLDTDYLGNLRRAGFAPGDIDLVMCTHLHFDHVGWNTMLDGGKWVPTFPNAKYLFGRKDYEYFKENPEGEEAHHESFADSIVPVMEAGQGIIVDENHVAHREIGDGVWLEPAFGHSPGCCTIHGQAGGEEAIFWGDVIHHPVQMIRYDLPFAFDADPPAASQTRQRVMKRAAEEDLLCFPAHFRKTSAGRVKVDGDVYRYEWV